MLGIIFISLQFSDMLSALLGFLILLIHMAIWLFIYDACRKKLEKKKQSEMNRMRIKDL
jgi:lysylphosphatidylglycerol synthetase-like protein (DUF2156 family)